MFWVLNKIKSSVLSIYSLIGIVIAFFYLWISHKLKKLHQAKEQLRIKDFVIEQQEAIIEDQKKQTERIDNVKEFYQDLRTKLNDFTE